MKRILIFPLVILLFSFDLISQDTLDVLPVDGRNELFHTFLMQRGGELWEARDAASTASLLSADSVIARQEKLRLNYRELLGDLPDKTDLSAEVVGITEADGYVIEKLHFQSRPNHHVTANFYIPDESEAPFPAVLVMCGHYPEGKSIDIYQKLCASLAKKDIAALIVDPFGQAERYQVMDPETGNLVFFGGSGTSAHTRLDVGAMLSGTSVVAHALWDNHRAIDYLYSRTDVVDTARIGCTGSSGGGSQATYLMAFDQRIKVAAVNSFLMNEQTLYETIGPQTGSQNLSYEGAHLIDHTEYVTMFAPKPLMILAATQDFFDVTATRETYAEATDVYTTLGFSDQVGYFEEDATHGYLQPRREEAVRWFRKWFFGVDSPVDEPDIEVLQNSALRVSPTGQVTRDFEDEKTITDLNVALADSQASARLDFWTENSTDSCLNKVRELIRLEQYEPIEVSEAGTIQRSGYSIKKLRINSGDHVPVTGLLFVPEQLESPAPAVIYVDGRGKDTDAGPGGVIEQHFMDSGMIVLSIDVRGFGETADNPSLNESKHGNKEHRNAVISGYIGKTLIGQRVEDIMKAVDYIVTLDDVDVGDVKLIGTDRAGSAALHAVALDPRISNADIRASFDSWLPMIGRPTDLHNLTHVVPFALGYYDLPDLVNALPVNSVQFFDDPLTETSSVDGEIINKKQPWMGQNFPNPGGGITSIPFYITSPGSVEIRIGDQTGRRVKSIKLGYLNKGEHQLACDVSEMPAGPYNYSLLIDGQLVASRIMSLIR